VSHGSLQDEELAQRELSQELWSAIQTLDSEFRAALVLFDVEGLSYGEIAEIEGVPIGTVRSRLSRARARIRRHLSASHPSLMPRGQRGVDGRRSSFPGARHEQKVG
jgi:DNA-directed RNA polymerase specialized sigma24 family protein